MYNLKTTKEKLAYIRGFFDGEGCIARGFSYNQKKPRRRRSIIIANTEKYVLEEIKLVLGEIGISSTLFSRDPVKIGYKRLWLLKTSGYNNLEIFYKRIGTSIVYKKERFKDVLKYKPYSKIPRRVKDGRISIESKRRGCRIKD